MKRCIGFLVGIILCLLLLPEPAVMQAAEVSAQACILMEGTTGQVLYEKNARTKRSMASTTKIMTTLLTLESGGLDTEFTVDSDAIHVEGSSMGLQEGDTVTKRALCYGMLLPSGNDAANAAAVAVAGSIPAFAEMMNARAARIGMEHTCFVTPSGLEGEGHGASAYDMALLAREAMQNPEFRAICCQQSARVHFGNPPYDRTLYNSNKLLGMCEGVIGIKTGFTDEAGRCLISACERDGIMLICVTLDAPDDWNDHIALYEETFPEMQRRQLPVPGMLRISVAGGVRPFVSLVPQEIPAFGALDGRSPDLRTRTELPPFLFAPVRQGDPVGRLLWYDAAGRCIAQRVLTAGEDCALSAEKTKKYRRFFFF